MTKVYQSPRDLIGQEGTTLGPTEWLAIEQTRVNGFAEVAHNYLREHNYNIWFTLISPSREDERATLADITARTGIPILNLPATRLFKIRVDFRMQD